MKKQRFLNRVESAVLALVMAAMSATHMRERRARSTLPSSCSLTNKRFVERECFGAPFFLSPIEEVMN